MKQHQIVRTQHSVTIHVAGVNRSRATHSRRNIDQDAPASAVLD